MAHASEILQKIGTANLRFVEVPVEVRYTRILRGRANRVLIR